MSANKNQRPKFYEEQFLGEADLTAAVDYSRAQQARHALGAHTWGIAAGLQLNEQNSPNGGGQVDLYLQPGLAWDGFGRALLVPSPYKIPSELFKAIVFDNAIDGGAPPGRLLKVWLRYVEADARQAGPGFAACAAENQFSRTEESFRVEIGERFGNAVHEQITIGDYTIDATTAAQKFDPQTPPTILFDETVAYQDLPLDRARARWLIPLGEVRWLPNQVASQAGNFVKRNADDLKHSRSLRRYVGVVAESVHAAEDHIRLRQRTKDYSTVVSDDLVWVEGKLRVEGDARLFGGKLDFRDKAGTDNGGIPLSIQRADVAGASSLQVVVGAAAAGANTFAVGALDAGAFKPKLTVRDDGKVGVGTTTPRNPLGIRGTGASEELLSFEDASGQTKWHVNQKLNNTPGLNFAETGVSGGDGRLFLKPGGNVGIGTTTPTGRLTLQGTQQPQQGTLTFFSATADIEYDGGNDKLFIIRHTGDGTTAFLGGNIGIGTLTPAFKLDVADRMRVRQGASPSAGMWFFQSIANADRAFVGMADDNHVGFWGNGGAGWGVAMDVNNGNVGVGTVFPALKLDIQGDFGRSNGAATLSLFGSHIGDRGNGVLFLRSGGSVVAFDGNDNVGIGTSAPDSRLHVAGDLRVVGVARGGPWAGGSDARLKTDIATLEGALDKLLQLRGVSFQWKEPEQMGHLPGTQIGLIAQEVEEVFPEWVGVAPDGFKEITIRGFEALTIEALRELRDEIESLKATSSKARTRRATPKAK